MARRQFRDPQPTDPGEVQKRNAAIHAVESFCRALGIEVPPLKECTGAISANVRGVSFIGKMPDGRDFGIGYEMTVK